MEKKWCKSPQKHCKHIANMLWKCHIYSMMKEELIFVNWILNDLICWQSENSNHKSILKSALYTHQRLHNINKLTVCKQSTCMYGIFTFYNLYTMYTYYIFYLANNYTATLHWIKYSELVIICAEKEKKSLKLTWTSVSNGEIWSGKSDFPMKYPFSDLSAIPIMKE